MTEGVVIKGKIVLIGKAPSKTSRILQSLPVGLCLSALQSLGSLYTFTELCSSLLPLSKNCKDNSIGMSESSTVIFLKVILLQGGDET